ncbi:MAG: hypothetical protein AAB874_03135 [Patescibacteria group bacterium]
MSFIFTKEWLITLHGFFVNLATGWFGAALFTPGFFYQPVWPVVLTFNLANGTLCLLAAVHIERRLMSYDS